MYALQRWIGFLGFLFVALFFFLEKFSHWKKALFSPGMVCEVQQSGQDRSKQKKAQRETISWVLYHPHLGKSNTLVDILRKITPTKLLFFTSLNLDSEKRTDTLYCFPNLQVNVVFPDIYHINKGTLPTRCSDKESALKARLTYESVMASAVTQMLHFKQTQVRDRRVETADTEQW